jgi:hypothetical protein
VTLADQWQPVEFYQVARGLRWKVRQALGGWMHQVARQDAQEAGSREASKLPEISDIGLRRCPHLNRRAATNAAPQSGTGGDQPTGRTQIVTFGRSTDRHGDDREAAQNGSLRIPSTCKGYAPRLPSHFHQNPAGIAPRAPSANENHVVPDALATPAEITSVGLHAMLSLAWRCRAGSPERGCCGWSARRIRERGGLAGQVPRGVGAALTRSQLFPQAWCRPGKLGSAGDHYAPGVARIDGRWARPAVTGLPQSGGSSAGAGRGRRPRYRWRP